jgi:hypothetical protein
MPEELVKIDLRKENGKWIFDDPGKGLVKEELTKSLEDVIRALTTKITDSESGFTLLMRDAPFSEQTFAFTKQQEEYGGCWYINEESGLTGWIGPSTRHYFSKFPDKLYVGARKIEAVDAKPKEITPPSITEYIAPNNNKLLNFFLESPPPIGKYLSYEVKSKIGTQTISSSYIFESEELEQLLGCIPPILLGDFIGDNDGDVTDAFGGWLENIDFSITTPIPVPAFVKFHSTSIGLIFEGVGEIFCSHCHRYYKVTELIKEKVRDENQIPRTRFFCSNGHIVCQENYDIDAG